VGYQPRFRTWRRLTRTEAINFFIAGLIAKDFDRHNQLVIDGDSGPVLQQIIQAAKLPRSFFADFKKIPCGMVFSLDKFVKHEELLALAVQIGYRGQSIQGIPRYLQSLPKRGPIGVRKKNKKSMK